MIKLKEMQRRIEALNKLLKVFIEHRNSFNQFICKQFTYEQLWLLISLLT